MEGDHNLIYLVKGYEGRKGGKITDIFQNIKNVFN